MFCKEAFFQETKVGSIPKDWEVAELGDSAIAEIILGQSPPSSTYNSEGNGLPFLQGKMEFGNIYPSPTSFCSEPTKIAEPNDILLSVRAPVGAVNIAQDRYCIGRGLSAIRAKKEKLSHLFLFYYLCSAERRFSSLSMGSTFKAIRKDEIERFSMPLPRIPEQKGIGEVLSCVDLAIQKTDEVIAKTERLKKGLMQKLLTEGIGHKEFKDTEIGTIPRTWQAITYGKVTNRITYGFTNPMPHVDKGHHIITAKNIIDGEIDYSSADVTSDEAYLRSLTGKSRPQRGDVLLSKDGTIGRSAVVDRDGLCISQSVALLIPKRDLIQPAFLSLSLESPTTQKLIQLHSATTTIPHLSITKVAKMRFGLPQIIEQDKIVEVISSVDRKLQLEKKQGGILRRVKSGLMDLLLTGRVRVRVD
jgi:type I restriction enzyme S subunit